MYGRADELEARRVLVVEDQALLAALLSNALTAAGFEVECAADAASALVATREFDPDAIVMDIDLGPGPSGMVVGSVLSRTRPDIAILYLTDRPELVAIAGQVPPRAGFLLKRQVRDVATLVDALESVLAERPESAQQAYVPPGQLPALDGRQLLTLRMVAQGLTNGAIAARMGASESSVERWLVTLFSALGIETHTHINPRVEAARRYIAAFGLPES